MALYPSDPSRKSNIKSTTIKIISKSRYQKRSESWRFIEFSKRIRKPLDSLVDITGHESFVVEDLNAIKNIFSRGLDINNYRSIIGSSVKFTVPTGETVSYDPRITYQNRIDKFEIFSGNPRFGGGGWINCQLLSKRSSKF